MVSTKELHSFCSICVCLLCSIDVSYATFKLHGVTIPLPLGFTNCWCIFFLLCGNMYSEDSRGLGMDSLVTLFCFVSFDTKHKIVDILYPSSQQ
jgi:hypothetical protein